MNEESQWHGTQLTDRGVIAFEGSDARDVLQGVVTSDVDALAPGRAVYTALLTPQGKYLFDFFLIDGGDRVLIDVQAARALPLAQRLSMYCLRRDARAVSGPAWEVAQVWGGPGDSAPKGAALTVQDPRLPELGWRCYGQDIGRMLTDGGGVIMTTPDAWIAHRIAHNVPESGIELVPEDTFILEAGFERLNGVDFRKGCYVGQEVTARMKHKAQLRKGLVQVTVQGHADPGTPITATGGKAAGTLFSSHGGAGLAHLRYDRAGPDMTAGGATVSYVGD
ncbi:MAG: folate-binding protein [Pseudomonadota bacterium]